MLSEMPK